MLLNMDGSMNSVYTSQIPDGAVPPWLWLACVVVALILVSVLVLGLTVIAVLCTLRPWEGTPNRTYAHVSMAPWPAFVLVMWLQGMLQRLAQQMLPPPARVADLALGFMPSQILLTLVTLDIPNHLRRHGSQTAQQLAAACGAASADQLARVLAAAHALELLGRSIDRGSSGSAGEPVYRLNALSAVLCDGEKEGVANLVQLFGMSGPTYCKLPQAILSGTSAFELSTGTRFWEHLSSDAAFAQRFDAGMRESSSIMGHAAIHDYPWGRFDTIFDIGGGKGGLTMELLRSWPRLRGVVVDQAHQVEHGKKWWSEAQPSLLPRVEFLAGDFFDAASLPSPRPGHSAYVMRNVLHDWPDAEAVLILKVLRDCITQEPQQHVTLIVLETGLFEASSCSLRRARRMADIHMLVHFGDAKERDEAAFRLLFAQSGWRLQRVVPTRGLIFAIEAVPNST